MELPRLLRARIACASTPDPRTSRPCVALFVQWQVKAAVRTAKMLFAKPGAQMHDVRIQCAKLLPTALGTYTPTTASMLLFDQRVSSFLST